MTIKRFKPYILHAPNIHTGGGLVLLLELLAVQTPSRKWQQLDSRLPRRVIEQQQGPLFLIKPSLVSRLMAELRLWKKSEQQDVVLCFHGLPPLLPLSAKVVVFVQNRILLNRSSLKGHGFFTRVRLQLERFWFRFCSGFVDHYVVQTPSMMLELKTLLGDKVSVSCQPVVPEDTLTMTDKTVLTEKSYDFIYVASGDAHKNHAQLLRAWQLLAQQGMFPSLVLTIDPEVFPELMKTLQQMIDDDGIRVINRSQLSREEVFQLYHDSRALIYPSRTESFGLPLIEAKQLGLEILAGELDYVRDIVEPVETFDPQSAVSIARAVRRFMRQPEASVMLQNAEAFMKEVLL